MAGEKSVILHMEDFEDVEELDDAAAGVLLKGVIRYMADGATDERLKGESLMMFRFIRRHIDRDKEKYNETCRKRSESGRSGAYAKQLKMAYAGEARENAANVAKVANAEFASERVAKVANAEFAKQDVANLANADFARNVVAKVADTESDTDTDSDTVSDTDPVSEPEAHAAAAVSAGPDEREKRIRFLETMCRLWKAGALADEGDYRRYVQELKQLKAMPPGGGRKR